MLQILYHGPREAVLPFFSSLGLVCPPHMAHADFLQEVATRADQHVSWRQPRASDS